MTAITKTSEDGRVHVHIGPCRSRLGAVAILVEGPEPNEVLRVFRATAYEVEARQMEHCRPVLTEDGRWATLGRAW